MVWGGPCSPEKAAKIAAAEKGKPRPWQHGKPSKPSKSGHFGIEWRHDTATPKWVVRIAKKKYGAFATLEEAIARRDQVLADPTITPGRTGRQAPIQFGLCYKRTWMGDSIQISV